MPKTGSRSNAGKGGKSSKTARVLSLLTDPAGASGAPETDEENNNRNMPIEPETPSSPRMDDKDAQEQIRDALVSELFGRKPAGRPARGSENGAAPSGRRVAPQRRNVPPEPNAPISGLSIEEPESDRASSVRSARERAAAAQNQARNAPASQNPAQNQNQAAAPVNQNPAPARNQNAPAQNQNPAPQAQNTRKELADNSPHPEYHDYICFNLTQALVEDKADKYMKAFNMCNCQRCKVDVVAISLSNLPSKYVATQSTEVLPLLSMYEKKNSAAVTAQVMNACELVKRRPHHR